MKILVDACLSPEWAGFLGQNGFVATHWSTLGSMQTPDLQLFQIARQQGYWIFTHDLDFGTILAFSGANGPSVIQARLQDISVGASGLVVIRALRQFDRLLQKGCILTILPGRNRVRILPLQLPSLDNPTTTIF
jgi:predicted nuclease of predicted toxin-antitoxin system